LIPPAADISNVMPTEYPRPGFGLGQAILWCLLFLLILNGGSVAFVVLAWIVAGVATGDPAGFARGEWDKLLESSDAIKQGQPYTLPAGLLTALAWGMMLGQLTALIFVWVLLRWRVGRDWRRRIAFRRPTALHLTLAIVATPGLMILHGGVHELVHTVFRQPLTADAGEAMRDVFAPWPWPLAVFVVGVLPGVLEEFFCRGFLGRGLVARYGVGTGILLTSVLFGVLHVLPLYALGTMVMGLALHVTYLASRSLWVPITIHAVNNSVTILATTGIIDAKALDQNAAGLGALVYLAASTAVAASLIAMWTGRVRLTPIDPALPPWSPSSPGVELPPTGVNTGTRAARASPAAIVIAVAATVALLYLLLR